MIPYNQNVVVEPLLAYSYTFLRKAETLSSHRWRVNLLGTVGKCEESGKRYTCG